MQPVPQTEKPELAAHIRRVGELASRLAPEGATSELCHGLDEAVEFAACEGKSICQAISEFLEDQAGAPGIDGLTRLIFPAISLPSPQLPVMPKAASRLLRTSDEGTSAAELEDIAGSDPAFAARLLGTANSVRFGSRFEIHRLRDAVMRVGVPESRKILLASCFARFFASQSLQELWEHSQFVAEAAWELAAACKVEPETAYITGLLHDIGRLGFSTFPVQARVAEQDWLAAGFPLVYAETLVYGRDHAAFGAELLRKWTLPAGIADAIEEHHRPEVSESRLTAAVHLAEHVSVRVAGTPEEDLWSSMRRRAALDRTGISEEQMNRVVVRQEELTRACA